MYKFAHIALSPEDVGIYLFGLERVVPTESSTLISRASCTDNCQSQDFDLGLDLRFAHIVSRLMSYSDRLKFMRQTQT